MTNSIDLIRGNDGSNLASSPTVTTLRSPGSTTILVSATTGLPASFIAEMGPLDLATGLIIGGVVFRGHTGTNEVIIDAIGVGYTDAGSAVNDVIVLKPTAEWTNNIADTLAVSHNDDGTLKDNSVVTADITDANVTTNKIADDNVTASKMVNGHVLSRRGGSATVWSTTGTTVYDTSATNVKIQCGSTTMDGDGVTTVTYPTAFTYTPIVVVTPRGSSGLTAGYYLGSESATTFTVVTNDATKITTFSWIAIGV